MKKISAFIAICIGTVMMFVAVSKVEMADRQKNPVTEHKKEDTGEVISSLPSRKILENNYHIYQTFNNCGPASLSMYLTYLDIHKSQKEIGNSLRPYQIPNGDNDDKSVSFSEFVEYSEELGFLAYHRPAGNTELLKQFVSNGIPVLTRTWLREGEDIGHYRIVKGYDDETEEFIQDDSYQGPNLRYGYDEFNRIWQAFNYEFLVIVPREKQAQVEEILGELSDTTRAWEVALSRSGADSFNASVSHYYLGNYEESVRIFEEVKYQLPPRMLWYQYEPIAAYAKLGDEKAVLAYTDAILQNGNRAFSELYLLRAEVYEMNGKMELANQEYNLALRYNKNLDLPN